MTIPKYRGLRLLPLSGIWGGNAGGKTNLLEALRFVKEFVSTGFNQQEFIPVDGFRPSTDKEEKPSFFSITFLVDTRIYLLEFWLTSHGVREENLYWLTHAREWRAIYCRTVDESGDNVNLSEIAAPELRSYDWKQLKLYENGCGPYRLFLTNTVDQRVETFKPIVNWFKYTLRYAGAGTAYTRFSKMMNDDKYCRLFSSILNAMDTGVEKVTLEDVATDDIWPSIPQEIRESILRHGDGTVQLEAGRKPGIPQEIYLVANTGGQIRIRRVQTYRTDRDGTSKPFGFHSESSGTRRLLEVLPIFTDLWGGDSECVWLLDEIDKEFHTDLTRALIERFLTRTNARSRRQMLFTTHDLMLMDQNLMRVDEINVVERKFNGESRLIPLHKYKGIRKDKDLRKSYLEGRFGGVPHLSTIEDIDDMSDAGDDKID